MQKLRIFLTAFLGLLLLSPAGISFGASVIGSPIDDGTVPASALTGTVTYSRLPLATSSSPGIIQPGSTLSISTTGVLNLTSTGVRDVRSYGAYCDGITVYDATASGNTVTSATHTFTNLDVGKKLGCLGAGSTFALSATSSVTLAWNTTIESTAGGIAYTTSTATTPVSSAECVFGHDDTTYFQAAEDATTTNGGAIVIPALTCITSTAIDVKNYVNHVGEHPTKSVVTWVSPSHMTSAMYQGLASTATSHYTGINFSGFKLDGRFAVQTSYTVEGKGIFIKYMEDPIIEKMTVVGFPATGIGPDYLYGGKLLYNTVKYNGRLNTDGTSQGAGLGGAGIGVALKGVSNAEEKLLIHGTVAEGNGSFDIFVEGYQDPVQSVIISESIIYMSATHGNGIGETGGYQSEIINNKIKVLGSLNVTSPIGQGSAIALRKGTTTTSRPGLLTLVMGNQIADVRDGILIDNTATGTTWPTSFSMQTEVANNYVKDVSRYCLLSKSESSYSDIVGLRVINNRFSSCKTYGNYFMGTYGYKALTVSGNEYRTAGSNAIRIESPVDIFKSEENLFYDTATTPTMTYGYTIYNAAVTNGALKNNMFNAVATPFRTAGTGSYAGVIQDNPGYNPIGAAEVAVTASPMTYTAGTSPETLYVRGGTVESILIGSVTAAEASPATIELPPNVAAIINFSATPSLTTYKH